MRGPVTNNLAAALEELSLLADDDSTHLFVRHLPTLVGDAKELPEGAPHEAELALGDWRTPRQGDIVARRYRVGDQARRTGYVVTVSARHVELDQTVALTYLTLDGCSDRDLVDSFSRRARLAGRVVSSCAARVLDTGRLVFGAPFAVVERPSGWTFAEVVGIRGRLPLEEAADYVARACRAIEHAYAAGFRRVQPNMTNLVLARDSNDAPAVKTVLFGAESVDAVHVVRTALNASDDLEDAVVLPYLAPEDVHDPDEQGGERADVWALGAIFFELYTGASPFAGPTPLQLLTRIADESPLDVVVLRPECPPEARAIIERCLAKDPLDRYATIGELAVDLSILRPCAEPVPVTRALIVRGSEPATHAVEGTTERHLEASSRGARQRKKWIDRAVSLAIGILLGVLGILAVELVTQITRHR
ncbi:MAG TPA: protein kinase [Polyangiaceae bacterium]|nr:protein kinase [Polyangiaceae bacterium]